MVKLLHQLIQLGYAWTPANPVLKVPIELTDEIKKEVVDFMIYFAKEIIEDEYNTRLKNLKNTTDLEVASWEIQKHEAREWLENKGLGGSKGNSALRLPIF